MLNSGGEAMVQRKWVKFFLTIITFIFFFGPQVTLYAQPYALEPFVGISVPTTIDLGSINQFGQQTFNSVVKAHIIANCPHHIEASIGAFANSAGDLIPKERTKVEMVPPLSSPIGTPVGGVDVNINLMFTIDIQSSDPAGKYTGTLVLTVTAGP
jgi:hypothetical protein